MKKLSLFLLTALCLLGGMLHCPAPIPYVVSSNGMATTPMIVNTFNANTTNTIYVTASGSNAVVGVYYALSAAQCTNYGNNLVGLSPGPYVQWWTNAAGYAFIYDPQQLVLSGSYYWGLAHTNYWSSVGNATWGAVSLSYPWAGLVGGYAHGIPTNLFFGTGPPNPLTASIVNGNLSVTGSLSIAVSSIANGPAQIQPLLSLSVIGTGGGAQPQLVFGSENDSDGITNGAIECVLDSRNYQGQNMDLMQLSAWDLSYGLPGTPGIEGRVAFMRYREPFAGGTNGGQIYLVVRPAGSSTFVNGVFIDTNGNCVLGNKAFPFESNSLSAAAEIAGNGQVDGNLTVGTVGGGANGSYSCITNNGMTIFNLITNKTGAPLFMPANSQTGSVCFESTGAQFILTNSAGTVEWIQH